VIGPSGCGKTTLLRIIAGLEDSSAGKVLLDGEEVSEPGQHVGLVFQEYALFPWRTVLENVEFGLEIKGVAKRERRKRALQYIITIGLEGFEDKYPKELSSGMKQRVGIARTLINQPKVLLMDEPFGSLDDQTRNNLQTHLLKIWVEAKRTILFVTHNIDEAIFLGQSIICFSSRPGTVKKALEVDLPYPRDRTDMEFNRYRKELQDFFRTEMSWSEHREKLSFLESQ
jgi:NitT/TauT family transport system ATP-binding protein